MSLVCLTTRKKACLIGHISVCKQNIFGRLYFPGELREKTEIIGIYFYHIIKQFEVINDENCSVECSLKMCKDVSVILNTENMQNIVKRLLAYVFHNIMNLLTVPILLLFIIP